MRGAGRREIGHGALAERALSAVIPDATAFPYTLRCVSDILESNGSSSMASVCGASLSLMDAGVPLSAAVSGVAMGLVKEGDDYAILTDIAGAEDHYGDMDFKVAGTAQGITALQMDIKVPNVTTAIMKEALEQARQGRLFILGKMNESLDKPRTAMSEYAPRIYTLKIPVDKIRDVIGPGGKVIRGIIEQTGVKIDVEDDGTVNVSSNDNIAAKKALQIINDLTASAEIGKTYLGKVVRLVDFGAFVEIFPRHRRSPAHQRNRRNAHQRRSRRTQRRRPDPGEGARARRQQDQAQPQGRAERTTRKIKGLVPVK